MMDFYKLPNRIKQDLREMHEGKSDDDIAKSIQYDYPEELINSVLVYNGIKGYTSFLMMLVEAAKEAHSK